MGNLSISGRDQPPGEVGIIFRSDQTKDGAKRQGDPVGADPPLLPRPPQQSGGGYIGTGAGHFRQPRGFSRLAAQHQEGHDKD